VLDFNGIKNVSTSFLSQATMPILRSYHGLPLSSRLEFLSPPDAFDGVLKAVLSAINAQSRT
jgi:hypothetical protein